VTADKVDFRPGHACYLFTALPRKSEHLDDRAVTPARRPRREDDARQLLVGEDPVTCFGDRRRLNSVAR